MTLDPPLDTFPQAESVDADMRHLYTHAIALRRALVFLRRNVALGTGISITIGVMGFYFAITIGVMGFYWYRYYYRCSDGYLLASPLL